MKKTITLLAVILGLTTMSYAQVAVTNDGSMPDNSAMLDVKSTDKGILVPRMTSAERDAIASPANGLLVFVTNDDQFYYNEGTSGSPNWTAMGGSGADSDWTVSGNDVYSSVSCNVGIGTTTPGSKLSIYNGNMTLSAEGSDAYIGITSDGLMDATQSYIWTEDSKGFAIGNNPGTPQFLVNAFSGNVGIGTTNPSSKLEVAGQIKLTGGVPGAGKVLTSDANGLGSWQNVSSGVQGIDDLSDAKAEAYSLFLGNNSGTNDDGTNYNTGVGVQSLRANTSGQRNIAFGTYALYNNTTGSANTSLGYASMYYNQTGYSNVAIGVRTLYRGTANHNIVAIGDSALRNNGYGATQADHGANNTAVGSKAMYLNTTGDRNSAFGTKSMYTNTTGKWNTALGYASLTSNQTGMQNTAVGNETMISNSSGGNNTVLGYRSLYSNTAGHSNVALGSNAGYSTSGTGNVFLGANAGYNETGSNKLYIDNQNIPNPLIYGEFDKDSLRINGELSVDETITTGGEYSYDSPQTYYYQVPAASFQAEVWSGPNSFWGTAIGFWLDDDEEGFAVADAPINLPDGAEIQAVKAYYKMDNDLPNSDEEIYVYFQRLDLVGDTLIIMAEGLTNTSTGWNMGSFVLTEENYSIINNSSNQYILSMYLFETDIGGQSNDPVFYGARIEYTINKVGN